MVTKTPGDWNLTDSVFTAETSDGAVGLNS
jgi:hypothetical protein